MVRSPNVQNMRTVANDNKEILKSVLSYADNHHYHIMIMSRKLGGKLSIKRIQEDRICFQCPLQLCCLFINATRLHPSSYFGNAFPLQSKILSGKKLLLFFTSTLQQIEPVVGLCLFFFATEVDKLSDLPQKLICSMLGSIPRFSKNC